VVVVVVEVVVGVEVEVEIKEENNEKDMYSIVDNSFFISLCS
jgi:hypothetical protein